MHFSKVLLCLLLTVAGTWLLWPTAGQSGGIHLLAGAGLRQPTDRLVDMFVQETGTEVHVSYGGAGQLMAQYLVTGKGDLFMPGAYSYIEKLQARQMIAAVEPIVLHTPVLAVNPKMVAEVTCLKDLCRPKLRVGLGDPASMALGTARRRDPCKSRAAGTGQVPRDRIRRHRQAVGTLCGPGICGCSHHRAGRCVSI